RRLSARGPVQFTRSVDREIVELLSIEKRRRALFEQHRDCRAASRHDTERRNNADALPVHDRHAAPWIQDMAVTPAVEIETALVVAAGRNSAIIDLQQ